MTEHLANGQFARKDVTEGSTPVRDTSRIGKGKPGPGRPKGIPNKTTRAVKEFLASLCDSAEVKEAVKGRILAGDAVAFFRALEHVAGKPKENLDVTMTIRGLDERIKQGRKRLGDPAP